MNTPITDAALERGNLLANVPADLARQLERDRARLIQALKTLTEVATEATKATTNGAEQVALMRLITPCGQSRFLLASLEIKDDK